MMIKSFMKFSLILVLSSIILLSCGDVKDNNLADNNLKKEIENAQVTAFSGFYFVGNYSGMPAIYMYDYSIDKYKVFWHSDRERVIDLLISPDKNSCFFITKRKQRLKSSQPAIEKGKLYRIDFEINNVESITQLEEGIQVIPFWIDNDRFSLVINSIDKTIASYVNKNIQVYNRFGKLLSDNTEVYDLTKDGYPITKLPEINYESPNGLFTVIEKNDSIIVHQKNSQYDISTEFTAGKILQLGWAENIKHLIMLIKSNDQEKQSADDISDILLVIYDLQKKKTVEIFNTLGNAHFVLIGDFLIFDNGVGKDSYIEMYRLDSLTNYKTIKINGGCGLRNI